MILILTGSVHSGKTSLLQNLLPVLKARGIPVSGYLNLAVREQSRTSGYDFFDIKTGRIAPFLRRTGRPGWQKVGPFFFRPSTLRAAENTILGHPLGGWLVVDELGPQELAGRGVWPALSAALSRPEVDCVLVVRKPLLDEFRSLLGRRPLEVFDVAEENTEPALLERLSKGQREE